MDENNSGATPPTNPTEPTPEIPVVDNTQPVEEPAPEPSADASASASEAASTEPAADSLLASAAPSDPAASAADSAPADSSAVAADASSSADSSASETPILSGTPRSLSGSAPAGSVEAGGPTSAFGASAITSKPKSKVLPVALALVLVLGLGGAAAALYFLNRPTTPDTPDISADETPTQEQEPVSTYALSGNSLSDFDLAFLRLENSGDKASDNKIYSPLSIKYALAMLADASAGDTKSQITSLIGNYSPKAYLNSANRSLANAMFINTTFTDQVKDSYTSTLAEKYNAEVKVDSFSTPDNLNTWVSDKTLGIITNMFDETTVNPELAYMLINALAIDMNWNNQLTCARVIVQNDSGSYENQSLPCKSDYNTSASYIHENYSNPVDFVGDVSEFPKMTFSGTDNVSSARVAVSANKYDIMTELGEDTVRTTVNDAYEAWLKELDADPTRKASANTDFDLNAYMTELGANYGKFAESTDFSFADNATEKIFAKDLQEYDGSTLEYIGVMPKDTSLTSYLSSLTADSLTEKINNLTTPSLETLKDGVVTKFYANIPFFKFSYDLNLKSDLESLGITDVFNTTTADLSGMLNISEETLAGENRPYIDVAAHKADIDFSNDGIKAAAVTAFGGKGAGGEEYFHYEWDVPVEEIDLSFDQPFFFIIRDKSTGEVWFTGEVLNLSAE